MRIRPFVASCFSAILLISIFPLFSYSYIAWIAFIPLLWMIRNEPEGRPFFYGFATGFIFFIGLLYWLIGTMMRFGGLSLLLSISALILLCIYLSLYFGIFTLLIDQIIKKTSIEFSLAVPVVWVSLELIRSYLPTGFPWGIIGYSQAHITRIIQIADFTGVYGVSFIILFINALLTDILIHVFAQGGKDQRYKIIAKDFALLVITFSIVIVYGNNRVNLFNRQYNNNVEITLIQGNVAQDIKRDITKNYEILEIYGSLSLGVAGKRDQLIIWPESAYNSPVAINRGEGFDSLSDWAKNIGCALLLGSPRYDMESGYMYNSALFFSSTGNLEGYYDKIHLVPFGEYFPIKWVGESLVKLGSFSSGSDLKLFNYNGVNFSVIICFEAIFPHLCRRFVAKGANFLVNLTNDAWFGKTAAPYQHFDMVCFRAVENRVWLVRAANTGITAFINPLGEVKKKGGIFQRAVIGGKVSVSPMKGIFVKTGDLFAKLCILISLLWCIFLINKGKKMQK